MRERMKREAEDVFRDKKSHMNLYEIGDPSCLGRNNRVAFISKEKDSRYYCPEGEESRLHSYSCKRIADIIGQMEISLPMRIQLQSLSLEIYLPPSILLSRKASFNEISML